MSVRQHIPIGTLWSMRIDVPYSLMLRQGDFAWSCGQVPLDGDGRVLEPDDPSGQARILADYIDQILGGVGFDRGAVGKLVVYHTGGAETFHAIEIELRRSFGNVPLLCPMAVPHFYYDGLTLEVDVFAYGPGAATTEREPIDGLTIRQVAFGDFAYISISSTDDRVDVVDMALAARGLGADRLLSDHWSVASNASDDFLSHLAERGFVSDVGASVRMTAGDGQCHGVLTFARSPVLVTKSLSEGLRVISRHREPFLWVSARAVGGGDLLNQTRRIMRGLETALADCGFGFPEVVKSTTHYVAGRSEAELHENMQIRNACYTKPGPASTGVPVAGLCEPSSLIAVDVLAVRRAPSGGAGAALGV